MTKLTSVQVSNKHLLSFESIFDMWRSPIHLAYVADKNEGKLNRFPNFIEILDEQEKRLDQDIVSPEGHETHYIGYDPNGTLCSLGLDIVQEMYPTKEVIPTGGVYYPPMSYMGWHTNSDFVGKRVYVSWSAKADRNFFRYKVGENTYTDFDKAGVNIREFTLTKDPLFWHCVGCSTQRFSLGYAVL